MIIIGLTGGVASGKSFVMDYLKKLNIPIHESDLVVGLLYKQPTLNFIDYLKKKGFEKAIVKTKINKKTIRDEIFKNENKRKELEKYIHKEVKKNRDNFLRKNKDKLIVFLDIPLLFEKKLQTICNYICSTIAPLKIRQRRAIQRPGMTIKMFNQIVKSQIKDKIRKEKSNYIINTSFSKLKTYIQVDKIIYDILIKENERGK